MTVARGFKEARAITASTCRFKAENLDATQDRHVNLQRSTTADRDRRGGKENPDLKVRQDPQVRPAGRYWAWIPLWRYSSDWRFSHS
jgi:hypothetical protein